MWASVASRFFPTTITWWRVSIGKQHGAVTWGSETSGVSGTISAANSLIGTNPGDAVGRRRHHPLSDGQLRGESPGWNNGMGAATFGCGSSLNSCGSNGITGTVSATNSLVGSVDSSNDPSGYGGDQVGSGGITALPDGNYLVLSPYWSSGKGAVTWGDGASGTIVGTVSASNSLVGSLDYSTDLSGYGGDQVGSSNVPL